jgi:LPPG:FO 2-phospho-L-lactate transferase
MNIAVTQLSGGVGGARLARGFDRLEDADLTVIVNVGDDLPYHGLAVSPDLDTVVYTLAGVEGPQGWGRADDSFAAHQEMGRFWPEDDFMVGDLDLALKLFRTRLMAEGATLAVATEAIRRAFGVRSAVIPASDDELRTTIVTEGGERLDFREYFVTRRHEDRIQEVVFSGAESASPAPGVIGAIAGADILVIGPSNPPLSIWPILAIPGVREAVAAHPRVIGVSPLIGGRAVKGPAAEVLADLGLGSGTEAVLAGYPDLLDVLVVDTADRAGTGDRSGTLVVAADTRISEPEAARTLAAAILAL